MIVDSYSNLIRAVEARDEQSVKQLLSIRRRPYLQKQWQQAMQVAIKQDDVSICRVLLTFQRHPFSSIRNMAYQNVLHLAILFNSPHVFHEALKQCPSLIEKREATGKTPLMFAVQQGCLWALEALKNHVDCSVKDLAGNSLWHLAILPEDTAVLAWLLTHYPLDIEAQDNQQHTACYIAVIKQRISHLKLLLKHVTPAMLQSHPDRDSLLNLALEKSDYHTARVLLDAGVPTDMRSDRLRHNTPLHILVEKNALAFLKYGLSQGMDPNVYNDIYDTPLHCAVSKDNLEAAKLLIAYGANVNALGGRHHVKQTPLYRAVKTKKVAMVRWLLSQGASVKMTSASKQAIDGCVKGWLKAYEAGDMAEVAVFQEMAKCLWAYGASWPNCSKLNATLQRANHQDIRGVIERHYMKEKMMYALKVKRDIVSTALPKTLQLPVEVWRHVFRFLFPASWVNSYVNTGVHPMGYEASLSRLIYSADQRLLQQSSEGCGWSRNHMAVTPVLFSPIGTSLHAKAMMTGEPESLASTSTPHLKK